LRSRRHQLDLPRGRVARGIVAAALLLAAAGVTAAGDAAAPNATTTTEAGRSTVATIVAGIVSYTRWPAEMPSIRLCTLGQGRGVDDLLSSADLGSAQLSVPVRAASDAGALDECDAIYVGALTNDAARRVLQRTVGRPVLMIGEGAEFCTDGGMFCLQPGAPAVAFGVNLDAVARSGLKVNPRVLRMARQTTGGAP
jgi:hypothetical protein